MRRRLDHGRWGGPIETFDVYEDWRDERMALVEAGVNPRTGEPFEGALLEAFQQGRILEASPDAKADFATFMWEPLQANFYDGYDYVQSQYRRFVGIQSVNSFDEVRIKGINGLTGIGYVGELGEYPGLRRTFRPEAAIVVDTYGGEYAMTRKLLRSNGIDKIVARNPADIGTAMGDFITRMIVALIVANPTAPDGSAVYNGTRGNLVVADLSEDSVVDAAVWLGTRRDPDNRPIRTRLRTAVVQNDRQALRLRQIANSQTLQIQTSGTPEANDQFGRGTLNPIADSGIIPPDGIVIDPWFPDAEDVYFFADPDRNPAFVAAFLDGQERPMIGMEDATVMHLANSNGSGHDPYSFQGDAIRYKTRHDVGVSVVEPLGTYKLAPA
jgi:hypothetical protein